jgi:ribitol-5-phosphate 2-dehydrogenase (NADP+) / D-ribitol-5-phosphate cytidylyltransferase
VPIAVVRGEDRNMKVTEPIDVFLADRLFQLESQQLPTTRSEADQRAALQGKTMVVFGGTSGIGHAIVDLARDWGADVFSFSRVGDRGARRAARTSSRPGTRCCRRGRVDHVVNSAAVLLRGDLAEASEESI